MEAAVAYLRYCPRICLGEVGETTKYISQDSPRSDRHSTKAPPESKAEALQLEPTSSVVVSV
jgi:hypothetical protein